MLLVALGFGKDVALFNFATVEICQFIMISCIAHLFSCALEHKIACVIDGLPRSSQPVYRGFCDTSGCIGRAVLPVVY